MDPDTEGSSSVSTAPPQTSTTVADELSQPQQPCDKPQDVTAVTLPYKIPANSDLEESPLSKLKSAKQQHQQQEQQEQQQSDIATPRSATAAEQEDDEQTEARTRRVEDSPAPVSPSGENTDRNEQRQSSSAAAAAAAAASSSQARPQYNNKNSKSSGGKRHTEEPNKPEHVRLAPDPEVVQLKLELAQLGCSVYAGAIASLRLPSSQPAPDPGDKCETPRTVKSLADLAQIGSDWEAVVPVVRHRDTIRAYLLMLSKNKDAVRKERGAKKAAVTTVMQSLADLDYLCNEKVGLERRHAKLAHPQQQQQQLPMKRGGGASSNGGGKRSNSHSVNLMGSGGDDNAQHANDVKKRIERVVEELDAAKSKLQQAMGQLPGAGTASAAAAASREERLAARSRPWATSRLTPHKPSPRKRKVHDGDDDGGDGGVGAEDDDDDGVPCIPRKAFVCRPEELRPRFGPFSKAGTEHMREETSKKFAAGQEALREKEKIDELRRHVMFNPPLPPPVSPAPPRTPPPTAASAADAIRGFHVSPSPAQNATTAAAAAATSIFPYARVSVFSADFEHASRAPIIASASINCQPVPGSPRMRRASGASGPKPGPRLSPERQALRMSGGVIGVAFGTGGAPPIAPHAAPSNSDGGKIFFSAAAAASLGRNSRAEGGGSIRRGSASSACVGGEMRTNVASDPNVELLSEVVRGRDAELKRLRAKAASANPFYKMYGAAARAMTHGSGGAGSKTAAETTTGGAASLSQQQQQQQKQSFAAGSFSSVPAAAAAAASKSTPGRRAPSPAFWGVTTPADETLNANSRFVLHGHRPASAPATRK